MRFVSLKLLPEFFKLMIEILLASVIVGQVQISPYVIQVDHLTPDNSIVTTLQNIEILEDRD